MRRRYSQRRNYPIWIGLTALAGVAVLALGWRQGWFPMELADADTGTLVQIPQQPAAAPPARLPANAIESAEPLQVEVPEFLTLQDEPSETLASVSAAPPARTTEGHSSVSLVERLQAERETTIRQAGFQQSENGQNPDPVQEKVETGFLVEIDKLIEAGQDITAHRELSKIYWNHPELRDTIQSRIEKTAFSIYLAPQPHYLKPYEVRPGDQLRLIAMKYNVPWEYLAKLNRIEPTKIRPGQKLKVIRGPFSAVVDLSDFRLTVHCQGYYVHHYTVGIGKDGTSPIGRFRVEEKLPNPTYYGPDGVIAADNPENPLGEYWIGIGNSYGLHGTIEPDSIGKAESKGCIRLAEDDIAEVYQLLSVDSDVIMRR